jgi:hypothetical protein
MVARALTWTVILICGGACHRPSPEQQLVGTWEWHSIDASGYYVLSADHTYAMIGDRDADGTPHNFLAISGSWRVEGSQLFFDGVLAQPHDLDPPRPPKRFSDRVAISDFLRDMKRHAPVSYDIP